MGEAVPLAGLPTAERPRERLLARGVGALGDSELIALVLRTGNGEQDAVGLARSLLDRFGGVDGVLSQDSAALLEVSGLGKAKVAALVAIRELLARAEWSDLKKKRKLLDSESVRRFLTMRLAGLQREVFGVVLLDTRHQVLAFEKLFFGSVDRSCVYIREVVKCCLRHNAAALILFHNHPSGVPEPSETDRHITDRLVAVLEEIDVRVLDHVVVGGMKQVSMAERGLLP